jgi:hypothetical protein
LISWIHSRLSVLNRGKALDIGVFGDARLEEDVLVVCLGDEVRKCGLWGTPKPPAIAAIDDTY